MQLALYVTKNYNQTVFDSDSDWGRGGYGGVFFWGGGVWWANTKIVPIFESIKKPYKEPPPTVCKINIIDFDNLAHRLP